MTRQSPYGTWASPLSSELLVSDAVQLGYLMGDGDSLYWTEMRPQESGRQVVVERDAQGAIRDRIPEGFSARTLVHEYGGRSFAVHEGVIYFSNFMDQRIYRVERNTGPEALTPEPREPRSTRFADYAVTPDGRFLVSVRERHEAQGVINDLVAVDLSGAAPIRVLASGHDFYAAPALSSDGRKLAWICWNHPQMPWYGTELYEARWDGDGHPSDVRLVAGSTRESVLQPQYGVGDVLHYVSDRSGWWNVYRDGPSGAECVLATEAECATPPWVLGTSSYATLASGDVVLAWQDDGRQHLAAVSPDGHARRVDGPGESFDFVTASPRGIAAVVASRTAPAIVAEYDVNDAAWSTYRWSRPLSVDASYFSIPEEIEFPTEDGLSAFAFYYPPVNPDFVAPDGELPPLIVHSHGGPTADASPVLDFSVQYWTSRGFAVVDVNYGGSTGYGRQYRERLRGRWGIVDLDDCVNAALYLARTGRADERRLLIAGGSAGGYTTLCALTFRRVFAAGASYYGVADLAALAKDTHKFESRYLDSLVGPWPESNDVYEARSPIHHTEKLQTPMIILQGMEDAVVPPAQAEMMVTALANKGVPYAYVTYDGEQHGFRLAKNIIHATESELSFYSQVLGFTPADDVVPVPIENRSALR
jgi:dipeptidyl aminopeptidase/acylaminoacyl peptidase